MCGRFTLTASGAIVKKLFPLFDVSGLEPRYNIAPTQPVAVVRLKRDTHEPELTSMRWGLIPSWADDPAVGARMINARAETAATKPPFRAAYQQRRCLVLADGFYEWEKLGARKQPYFIRLASGEPFAFAGLWERWRRGEQRIDSCTILTTDANELVRPLHDRMPVIVSPDAFDDWLHPGTGDERLLRPYPSDEMEAFPVSPRVNSPRTDDAACIARVDPPRDVTLF